MTDGTAGGDGERELRSVNRRMWDERVAHHLASEFYDAAGFLAGTNDPIRDFEPAELGDVDGADLVHLQCHFGLDTLGWARRGALVVGLDFSGEAVAAARRIAADAGLAATFVESDVYDAVEAIGSTAGVPDAFDVVYTGLGALNWIGDLSAWARVVSDLLRPGGVLYLVEFHPFAEVFAWTGRTVERDYFATGPERWDEPGTYTDTDEGVTWEYTSSVEWSHSLAEVLGAVLGAGLVLESFAEHDHTLYARWPDMVVDERGRYRLPEGEPGLPLMYSLRARRPG